MLGVSLMKALSRTAKSIAPSATLAISALSKQMRADGIDVIGFDAPTGKIETEEADLALNRKGFARA